MSKLVGVPGTADELTSAWTVSCSVGESRSPRRARYRAPENAYNKMTNKMLNWTTSIKMTRNSIRTNAPVALTMQKYKQILNLQHRHTGIATHAIAYISHMPTLGLRHTFVQYMEVHLKAVTYLNILRPTKR